MNTNIIPLKEKLSFTQYQAIIKFLNDIGVEVADSEIDQYDNILTQEDIEAIMLSRKQIQMGLGIKKSKKKGKDHGNNMVSSSKGKPHSNTRILGYTQ